MSCLSILLLISELTNQCMINNQTFEHIGFNADKTTLIVQCSQTRFFMKNFLKGNECFTLKEKK